MHHHSHLRRWGAVYILVGFFVISSGAQFVATIQTVHQDAVTHALQFEWGEVWLRFLSATFENWQSEWLQLIVQAVLLLGMKHLVFAADAEDMEEVQRDLADIKRYLEQQQAPPDPAGVHRAT